MDDDKCVLGAENKANIDNLKEALDEFKIEVRTDIKHINQCVEKITNHYSGKPSWLVLIIVSALLSAVSTMGMYIITLP